ncbi:MAG: Crp/Fnr family transcriptional regulator [Lachnospiraceae bacterium]
MEMPVPHREVPAAWEAALPILKKSQLFAGVHENEIVPMLHCTGAYQKTFQSGEAILLKEDSVPCAGLILKGSVQMVQEDVFGVRTILMTLGPGEFFGESFACGTQLHACVTFEAQTDTKAVYFPFHRMLTMCGSACSFHQRLIENMVFLLADKNTRLMAKLEILSKRTLTQKILSLLSFEAQRAGSLYFTLPMNRDEMAEYLCVNRSALSRELSLMKDKGLIDYDRNTFRILRTGEEG